MPVETLSIELNTKGNADILDITQDVSSCIADSGLQKVEANKINRVVVGEKALYMIATMTFADKDALKAGMNSPEMAAVGENLDGFAKDMYTLCFAEEI